jgi:uncharacterized protein (TIGR00369 family)
MNTVADKIFPADSPFATLLGLRLAQWNSDSVCLELPVSAQTRNIDGSLHGGVIASLVDLAGSLAGCYTVNPLLKPRVVSLNLNVNFVSPAGEGVVWAKGCKRGGGKRIFMSSVDVTDAAGRLIATGQGTFKIVANR